MPNALEASHRVSPERGIALILVLWTLALIAALVVMFLGNANSALNVARNEHAAAQARVLAESGLNLAVTKLLGANGGTDWRADVTPYELSYDGGTITISVEDESGKIDLNMAPPELLVGLFRTLGESDAQALSIAAAIVAWRAGKGSASGGADGTVGRQFLDVSELAQVSGVDRDLARRASPFLTVYSFSPYVNPMTAPAEVLRSLPGVDAAAIEKFVSDRAGASDATSTPALPGARDMAVAQLSTVRITAHARSALGGRFTREAVVSLSGGAGSLGYAILAWGQPRQVAATASGSP